MDASASASGPAGSPAEQCKPGDWVEIKVVLLEPAERAAGLPPDTADKPFVMWVKGFAQDEAAVGEALAVETASGRVVGGALFAVNPGYFHTFGAPIPELTHVGRDLRRSVAAWRASQEGGAS